MNVPLAATPTTTGASAGVNRKSGSLIRKSAYGLGFRFSVRIDAMPLGRWQSCAGLKVSFKNTEIRKGGDYTSVDWLADRIAYGNIVLKRAADADSSAKVQAWLAASARAWMEGDPSSSASDATITLLDSKRKPVLTWTLREARPAAWSVSDLDAMSSKLAIETLELAHKGFEVQARGTIPMPPPPPPVTAGAAKTTGPELPRLSTDKVKEVVFRFPPEKVTIIRNTDDRSSNQIVQLAQGEATALQNKPGVSSYKMESLVIDGPTTQRDVALLLEWATEVQQTEAQSTAKPADKGDKTGGSKKLPEITFKWGTAFNEQVQLSQLTAGYTRFSATGEPLRAMVTITLDVVPEKAVKTGPRSNADAPPTDASVNGAGNPTSGGIPGRASHLLLATDSLPLLAREHYGSPDAWRDIARANNIDDPVHIRPGSRLYLPAFSELTEVGERR